MCGAFEQEFLMVWFTLSSGMRVEDWLLRELKATSLRAFFLLRQVASPSLSKEGLGRIVGIGKAAGHPSLFAKGLQGGLLRVVGERNWLLREPMARFVTPIPSLPRASLQTLAIGLRGSLSHFFLFVSLLSCKPEYAYKQKKASVN